MRNVERGRYRFVAEDADGKVAAEARGAHVLSRSSARCLFPIPILIFLKRDAPCVGAWTEA
jgi:hypothetical protein